MIEVAATVADWIASVALPIAHELDVPHEEPASSDGGTSVVVILVGVVATLAAVAGLVWLKQRTDR